ncbi:MAG TPA: (d)CMP kinase [Erysipelothrix sp.]|nr:(d)CMP kinase [Erysipelothrix sp.]
MSFSIAIDGPSASGKSVLAMRIARHLQMIHINTGSMYRAVAYVVAQKELSIESDLDEILTMIDKMDLQLKADQKVFLNQVDITLALREETISLLASDISKNRWVREKLVEKQQAMAQQMDCVMDGRDIGTVVLPQAQVKIFLTASTQVRAMRRFLELKARGLNPQFEELKQDLMVRDYQDRHRQESPLRPAEDAIIIDTSALSLDEVFDEILMIIEKKKKGVVTHD